MPQRLVAEALAHTLWKQNVLSAEQCARLAEVLLQEQVETVAHLRTWTDRATGISAELSRAIRRALPPENMGHFGPYEPLAFLDQGGMGAVWLARSTTPDAQSELVVVKVLQSSLANGEEYLHRFRREAEIMQRLQHPNLVSCLDSGLAADKSFYTVLELVPFRTLRDLAAQQPLPELLALQVMHQVADVLALAEEHHLIHRDIKPGNIFADAQGRALLADFGLARSTSDDRTALTMQGAMVGTPHYMAPEQILGTGTIDIRADIYSLGGALFYALAGREPYSGKLHEVLHAHQTAPPPRTQDLRADVGEATDAIIATAMAKRPEDRHPTAAACRDALATRIHALGGEVRCWHAESRARLEPTIHVENRSPGSGPRNTARILNDLSQTASFAGLVRRQRDDGDAQIGDDSTDALVDGTTPCGGGLGDTSVVVRDGDAYASSNWGRSQSALSTHGHGNVPGLVGDLDAAMDQDWIALVESEGISLVLLWARPELCLGKMREPPVAICLRNYPVKVHKQACQQVSRQHLRLAYDPCVGAMRLADLGSANGTTLDGSPLDAHAPLALAPGPDHKVVVAGTISLRMRVIAAASHVGVVIPGAPASRRTSVCGIEHAHPYDGVVLSRPDNYPELAYAMVLRRLSIGAADADLTLVGGIGGETIEVGRWDGRWIWRPAGQSASWMPLSDGDLVRCAGKHLTALPAHYGRFH